MHTTATLHVHPAAAVPSLIFHVRRLAKDHGCRFVPQLVKAAPTAPATTGPWNGGSAA